MPQATWTGQLSFGLVNIPVKLYTATTPKNVRFHQYDRTGRRIRYRRVAEGPPLEPVEPALEPVESPEDATPAPEDLSSEPGDRGMAPESPLTDQRAPRIDLERAAGAATHLEPAEEAPGDEEVPWEEIVKGFEVEPGRVVTVDPDELMSLAPERSEALEVEQFIPLEKVDPVYFDKTYYVVPKQGVGAERPYWLLYRAMESTGKVAIGRFVMRTKQYLAAVRPGEHVLTLETLFYADEVRDAKEVWFPPAEEPPDRELQMASQLIEALSADWDPSRHRDEYRERVLELLRSKGADSYVLPSPEEAPVAPVTDLLVALQASVEVAREARRGRRSEMG